jgi:hypothetical protein
MSDSVAPTIILYVQVFFASYKDSPTLSHPFAHNLSILSELLR